MQKDREHKIVRLQAALQGSLRLGDIIPVFIWRVWKGKYISETNELKNVILTEDQFRQFEAIHGGSHFVERRTDEDLWELQTDNNGNYYLQKIEGEPMHGETIWNNGTETDILHGETAYLVMQGSNGKPTIFLTHDGACEPIQEHTPETAFIPVESVPGSDFCENTKVNSIKQPEPLELEPVDFNEMKWQRLRMRRRSI